MSDFATIKVNYAEFLEIVIAIACLCTAVVLPSVQPAYAGMKLRLLNNGSRCKNEKIETNKYIWLRQIGMHTCSLPLIDQVLDCFYRIIATVRYFVQGLIVEWQIFCLQLIQR